MPVVTSLVENCLQGLEVRGVTVSSTVQYSTVQYSTVQSHLVNILIVSVSWLSRVVVVSRGGGVASLLAASSRPLGTSSSELSHGGTHQGEG